MRVAKPHVPRRDGDGHEGCQLDVVFIYNKLKLLKLLERLASMKERGGRSRKESSTSCWRQRRGQHLWTHVSSPPGWSSFSPTTFSSCTVAFVRGGGDEWRRGRPPLWTTCGALEHRLINTVHTLLAKTQRKHGETRALQVWGADWIYCFFSSQISIMARFGGRDWLVKHANGC